MTYIKNTWVDQQVERPRTYQFNSNPDGSTTLIDDFGQVTEIGTPVNADNLNHIEDGLVGVAIRLHNMTEVFAKDEWVKSGDKLYKSKQDQNKGHAVTEPEWYSEVSLGGGMPVGTIFSHIASASFVPENSLACDGTEYRAGQFNALWNDFLITKRLNTCTYEEYQQEITSTGECLKFGIDTVKRTFKVPTKKNQIINNVSSNSTAPVKGNGKAMVYTTGSRELSIGTRGAGGFRDWYTQMVTSDNNAQAGTTGSLISGINPNCARLGLTTNANNSGVVADLSNTINTKTKEIRYFVVVATGSIKQSEMDWSQWASSLQGKANVDLNNADQSKLLTGKITNCILEAPNGVMTSSGVNLTLKQGVRGLIPNGFNPDGTLKNIVATTSKDITVKRDGSTNPYPAFAFAQFDNLGNVVNLIWLWDRVRFYQNEKPINLAIAVALWYKPADNFWYFTADEGKTWSKVYGFEVGKVEALSGGGIQEYSDKPISLLKYSEKYDITSWGMPSREKTELSVSASGSFYTMPDNGYLTATLKCTGHSKIAFGVGETGLYEQIYGDNGDDLGMTRPVKKGEKVQFYYGNNSYVGLRFTKLEGNV